MPSAGTGSMQRGVREPPAVGQHAQRLRVELEAKPRRCGWVARDVEIRMLHIELPHRERERACMYDNIGLSVLINLSRERRYIE